MPLLYACPVTSSREARPDLSSDDANLLIIIPFKEQDGPIQGRYDDLKERFPVWKASTV